MEDTEGQILRFYRINQYIQSPQIRLLDESGKQIGVVKREEALAKARELGVDLVEIAPNAKPPVVKLIEFKKFKYQEAKKEKDAKKKAKEVVVKEIRLRPFIGNHDLGTRINWAKGFLKDGNRVKFVVKFLGREMAHPQFGYELAKRVSKLLEEEAEFEREAHFEGKQLIFSLQPRNPKKDSNEKAKN